MLASSDLAGGPLLRLRAGAGAAAAAPPRGDERFAAALAAAGRRVTARYAPAAAAAPRPAGACFRAPPGAPRIAVVGFMKDEAHILREWLSHYLWQGADAVLLLDNGSTDAWREVVAGFPARRVEALPAPKRHRQEAQYNELARPWLLERRIDVVIVVDLDEFLFSRDERSLQEVLLEFFFSSADGGAAATAAAAEPRDAAAIFVPWSKFGSSGFVEQPPTVREHFLWAQRFPPARGAAPHNGKTVALVRSLARIGIHRHALDAGSALVAAGDRFEGEAFAAGFDARAGARPERAGPPLQLNHYAIQSWRFFEAVKMTRGAADVREHERVRDRAYFDRYDVREAEDVSLRDYVAAARRGGSRHPFRCAVEADPELRLE